MIGEYRDGFYVAETTYDHLKDLAARMRPEDVEVIMKEYGVAPDGLLPFLLNKDTLAISLLGEDGVYASIMSKAITKDLRMVWAMSTPGIKSVMRRVYPYLPKLLTYLMGDARQLVALKADLETTEIKLLKRFGFKVKSGVAFMKPGDCLAILNKEDLCQYQS